VDKEVAGMKKVTIATDWLESCAGCHMSFLDIDERLLELLESVEITSSPITDLKEPPEEGVDVGILTGAIGNSHQDQTARLMRSRARILVALGDCAVFGGICVLRNFFDREDILKRGYLETESTVEGNIPRSGELGQLCDKAVPVNGIVRVDVYLPGCPPSADAICFVLSELVAGRIPVLPHEHLRYD
jgi:NAD-reducing hydrogenase small subunit